MAESRYFRLTEKGRRLFGLKEGMRGRRMTWGQIPLDLFNDPDFLELPDSQKLPFIGVGLLCVRRDNLVLFSADSLRKSINLRVKPDLSLYMDEGLIEFDSASLQGHLLEKKEREEKRDTPLPPKGARPTASLVPALSWSNEAATDWIDRHGGKPPGPMFKALGALVPPKGPHVWSRVRPVLRFYLATRELDFLNWSKFAAGFGTLESEMLSGPPARASPAAQARVAQIVAGAKGGLLDERGVVEGLGSHGGESPGQGFDQGDGGRARPRLPGGPEPPERR